MGHSAFVRLAISLAANKNNRRPDTVPDSRCNIAEPLDEHQLCIVISHISQGVLSGMHAGTFCQIAALSQQASSYYSIAGKVMSPTSDHCKRGTFTGLAQLPQSHLSECDKQDR